MPDEKKLGPPIAAQDIAAGESAAPKVEPLEATAKEETAPEAQPAMEPEMKPAPVMAQMTDYHVKQGDTLWQIAEKVRAENRDVSVEQMILAIYRTNKDAFFGNNVNNLKAGKILKFPEREEADVGHVLAGAAGISRAIRRLAGIQAETGEREWRRQSSGSARAGSGGCAGDARAGSRSPRKNQPSRRRQRRR